MKKQLINEVRQLQKLAGLLKEGDNHLTAEEVKDTLLTADLTPEEMKKCRISDTNYGYVEFRYGYWEEHIPHNIANALEAHFDVKQNDVDTDEGRLYYYELRPKQNISRINEDEGKRTLERKEEIAEKLQYAIEDYLEDLGLRELSPEEKPKFQKGLGFTQTTPSDAFINKTRTHFHLMTPDDDPKRNDSRHNDQEVTYGLRIYKPNEKFNISTLRGFIQQAKREAKAEGFRFFDKLNRSNQDILFRATIR